MSFLDAIRHRGRAWLRRDDFDRALHDEIEFHLTLDQRQHRDLGLEAARRRFGNVAYTMEETRRMAKLHLLDNAIGDLRFLLRTLRRSPGFAVVSILTLALGIGLTTAAVSIADHVLLRGLPFRDSNQLVMLLERDEHGGFRGPSAPTAADWRADSGVAQAFEGVSFIRGDGVSLRVGDEQEVVGAGFVGPEFFPLVSVRPVLGRVLTNDDHRADAPPVAVMSHRLWQRRFGGDPGIVGRTINVDSVATTVVGIMPPGATYPPFADLWSPLSHYRHPEILQRRGLHADSRTIGRLKPGIDSARAASFMRPVGLRLAESHPVEQAAWMPAMITVQREIIGSVRPMLLTLTGAALAVLLLVCANVAGLLVARASARRRELAVRSALGASRGRMLRQLLTESLMLATLGGVVGTMLAASGVSFARSALAARLPRMDELSLDARALGVAIAATLITALLCGLWPALRITSRGARAHAELLRSSALGAVGGRSESRLRRVLVTVQFALALMLLVGAGLLLQSFRRAAAVDLGFDPRGVLSFRVRPPAGYDKPEDAAALYGRLMAAARSTPGVTDAAFINHAPFGGASIYSTVSVDGRSTLDSSNQILYRTVSAEYLRTMRMTMARGRWFDDADVRSPGGRFIINQTMAKLYWAGADPVGQRITIRRASQARADFGQPLAGTIVGVVADLRQTGRDALPEAEVYVPYTLETWPWGMLMVRTVEGSHAIPALARAVRSVDPRLIAEGKAGENQVGVLERAVDDSLQTRKASTGLLGVFAACALLLASIGLYGVMAYTITQRTREIGVRKALGASNRSIVAMVFRDSAVVIAGGIVLGVLGAAWGGQLIRAMLFDTRVSDPSTYVVTVALLSGAAVLATYLPARRATRLDPTIAIRGE